MADGGGEVFENRVSRRVVALVTQLLYKLADVARRDAPGVGRSEHRALTGLGNRSPELAVEQVGVGFDDDAGMRESLFVAAEDLAQASNLLGHALEHLADGVDAHFAAFVAV